MITLKEIVGQNNFDSLEPHHKNNLEVLLERINKIRGAYGKPMIVTSGYRSLKQHLAIYAAKGITDQSKIPMKSKHLVGAAVDIFDPDKELQTWVLANVKILEDAGLYCEDFSCTPNWCHFQIQAPASSSRFFKP
jgi:uncharacterized protein YcbK (DUF882 family)